MQAGFAAPVWRKARGAPAYATLLLLLSLMFILKERADAIADELEHPGGLQHHRLQFHYLRGEKGEQVDAAICWARRMLRSNAHHRHQHHHSQSSPPPSRPIPFFSQHDGGGGNRSPDLCGSRCAQSGGNTNHSVSSQDIDPRYGVDKRLVPTGPNPLHN